MSEASLQLVTSLVIVLIGTVSEASPDSHILPRKGRYVINEDLAEPALRSLAEDELLRILDEGYSYVDQLTQREAELLTNQLGMDRDSQTYKMAHYKHPTPEAQDLGRKGLVMLEMTRSLQKQIHLTEDQVSGINLRQVIANWTVVNSTCPIPPTCVTPSNKYRTMDGSCNSVSVALYGKSNTDYRRVLKASYCDGIQYPRCSVNSPSLPSARNVSIVAFNSLNVSSLNTTEALMQWGQFIAHDMQRTVQFSYANGSKISCCYPNNTMIPVSLAHPACFAINVLPNDPVFNFGGGPVTTCLNVVRSIVGPRNNCSTGYADQLNVNTHWLDGSTIYGSDNTTMKNVRLFIGGQLMMSNTTGRSLLPIAPTCTTKPCFYAGDTRVNEQPQLTVMHTLWVREHNRIAKQLANLNPSWNDEILFQEARRIVIAEIQHITYDQWLPQILNSTYLTNYGLVSSAPNYFTGYTGPTVQSSGPISNEFAAAAFRMGHSMVQGFVMLFDKNGALQSSSYTMSDTFNNASFLLQPGFVDNLLRGLMTEVAPQIDANIDTALRNKLFRALTSIYGSDLVAINIQRGRDHGLPGYNAYRAPCGLPTLKYFPDLSSSMTSDSISKLRSLYTSVDDIDLYVGGLHEIPTNGGVIGPTFSCLIAENMRNLKFTDRFFFEVNNQRNTFSKDQLLSISKTSLARVICDNNDGSITSVQPNIFVPPTGTNLLVSCSSIPSLNLNLWLNEPL